MTSVYIGDDAATGAPIRIPSNAFATHFHLIGGTGKGKTTAIHTMLQELFCGHRSNACVFVIDRFGSFTQELMLWMASRFCPESVRKRLVYVQGGNENLSSTINPLTHRTAGECYFKVERATAIILRAWESVNIEAMPRLARWTTNAFMGAAQLGLTISDCVHFLMPGSPYHSALLRLLPPLLQSEWAEITASRGSEAMRILDSSRNRMKPYFDSVILRRMFGSTRNRLDVARFMDEGRIVFIDLAPRTSLSPQLANTIGSLIINEIIATIRSRMPDIKCQTFLFLDEFQNFVGPDVETALPEMRQMGLNLVLSHQSLSQLERGDYDMTNMIFAAQSRMIFGVQGQDADLLANEVASLTYDARRVKQEIWSRRQLIKGHRIVELSSWNDAQGRAEQWTRTYGEAASDGRSEASRRFKITIDPVIHSSRTVAKSDSRGHGDSVSYQSSRGGHESLLPEYDQFLELASRTFDSFDDQKHEWASRIRRLETGTALLRLVNDPKLYTVRVKKSTPGLLAYDIQTIKSRFRETYDRMQQMIEENFRSDVFVSAADIDREIDDRIKNLVRPSTRIAGGTKVDATDRPELSPPENSHFT